MEGPHIIAEVAVRALPQPSLSIFYSSPCTSTRRGIPFFSRSTVYEILFLFLFIFTKK